MQLSAWNLNKAAWLHDGPTCCHAFVMTPSWRELRFEFWQVIALAEICCAHTVSIASRHRRHTALRTGLAKGSIDGIALTASVMPWLRLG